jgi:acetyl-CoA C-acetyltransferase
MIGSAVLTPARQAVLASRLPDTTPSFAVDRACCSGMTAIGLGFKDILAGQAETILAGGFESLSSTPLLMPRTREKALGALTLDDPLLLRAPMLDSSISVYTSEEALKHGVDRAAQDEWAVQSHERYFAAERKNYFDDERIPLSENNTVLLATDESPRVDTSLEKLRHLRTVGGSKTITAGNAPGLNDGAAALLMTSTSKAKELGLDVLAYVKGYAQVSDAPTSGSFTPAIAISKLLKRSGIVPGDLDLLEINEAFAATVLVSTLHLGNGEAGASALRAKTNLHGGAVAIGHPLGASGARVVMTLINGLHRRGGGIGAAAICGGFGQGDSILIEVRD